MATEAGVNHVGEGSTIWRVPGLHIEKTQRWGTISADIVSRAAGEGVWRSDHHRIVYALTDFPGTIKPDDRPARQSLLVRNYFSFLPRGVTLQSNYSEQIRFIQILQNPGTYDNFISDLVRGGAVPLEHRSAISDPLVSRIVLTIANDINCGFLDHILADTLNTALAVQITRQFFNPSAITLAPSNGLSHERLQRVRDYIEAHLAERLTLTDIAGVACLSPYHFSRSFKRATGVGLHRYVIRRRIERAKELVLNTDLSLAEIAWTVGFDGQASFTTRFQQEVGIPPGRLRADRT
jgi:AraC-like DNA-binding protein